MSKLKPFSIKTTNTGLLATRKEQDDVYSDIDDMDKAIPSGNMYYPAVNLQEYAFKKCINTVRKMESNLVI